MIGMIASRVDGLVLCKSQAITWNNADQDAWHHKAIGHNGLNGPS